MKLILKLNFYDKRVLINDIEDLKNSGEGWVGGGGGEQ